MAPRDGTLHVSAFLYRGGLRDRTVGDFAVDGPAPPRQYRVGQA